VFPLDDATDPVDKPGLELEWSGSKNQEETRMRTPRRPANPHEAAEALFKPVKKPATSAVERPTLPNVKELVTLKLDSEVLAYFQADGSGWQERINDALRAAMTNKD
jgi:uncharacterized protein (DUF4415 family)